MRRGAFLALLAAAVWLVMTGSAPAATDYDGDGATTTDCAPLDPAVHPGAADAPDLNFEDTDCDGVDGDPSKAYFVAVNGSNSGTGSKDIPFLTIQFAIDKAAADSPKKAVYVEGGTYTEHLVLASGVSIYGGYKPGGGRSATETTKIQAPAGQLEAILGTGTTNVVLQQLTVEGAAATGAGGSSYAVRAIGASSVALEGVSATGGAANPGADGATPAQAASGGAGQCAGFFSFFATCGMSYTGGSGGTGANNGGGGGSGHANADGDNGSDGTGPAKGTGATTYQQICFFGCFLTNNGNNGGAASAPGAGGAAGAGSTFTTANAGTTWTNGPVGPGGGAGGAGSGGGGAGGGGAGGTGGAGGGRGADGGGSFGLYLASGSTAVIVQSTLRGAAAGKGGDGALGGAGGGGGGGGAGMAGQSASESGCTGTAGSGGNGGSGSAGGQGGAGGGGAGGPSVGLFAAASKFVLKSGNALSGGTAGAGGNLGGTNLKSGDDGVSAGSLPAGQGSDTTTDFDGDGVTDANDACPTISSAGATDANGDGCPDRPAKLADSDGDGVPDNVDKCPTVAASPDANADGCTDTAATPTPTPTVKPGLPTVLATVTAKGRASAKKTSFTKFDVKKIPVGGAVQLRCSGKKKACPFKLRSLKVSAAHSATAIKTKKVKRHGKTVRVKVPLVIKVGGILEVRITAPNMIGEVFRYTIKKNVFPKRVKLCLAPGALAPAACA